MTGMRTVVDEEGPDRVSAGRGLHRRCLNECPEGEDNHLPGEASPRTDCSPGSRCVESWPNCAPRRGHGNDRYCATPPARSMVAGGDAGLDHAPAAPSGPGRYPETRPPSRSPEAARVSCLASSALARDPRGGSMRAYVSRPEDAAGATGTQVRVAEGPRSAESRDGVNATDTAGVCGSDTLPREGHGRSLCRTRAEVGR